MLILLGAGIIIITIIIAQSPVSSARPPAAFVCFLMTREGCSSFLRRG